MGRTYDLIRFVVVSITLCAMAAVTVPAWSAEPVVEALKRPSLPVRSPERAVYTDAALAGSRIVAVGERGLTILSDDNGQSWRQVPCPVSVTLTAVHFVDERNGMAVGHGGIVLRSVDGGESWTMRFDGNRAARLALDTAKASQDARAIGDAQWLVDSGPDKPFLDLLMFDKDNAMVVGAYGLVFATQDGGEHWECWMNRCENPQGLHYNAVRKRGNTIVIGGEQGMVLLSNDAGKRFRRIPTPYDGTFFTLELPSDGEILLAGLRGNIFYSRDEGRNWQRCASPMPVSVTGSTLLPDNRLLLVNQAGFILAPAENNTMVPINDHPLPVLNGLVPLNKNEMLALTIQGVMTINLKASSKADS